MLHEIINITTKTFGLHKLSPTTGYVSLYTSPASQVLVGTWTEVLKVVQKCSIIKKNNWTLYEPKQSMTWHSIHFSQHIIRFLFLHYYFV